MTNLMIFIIGFIVGFIIGLITGYIKGAIALEDYLKGQDKEVKQHG